VVTPEANAMPDGMPNDMPDATREAVREARHGLMLPIEAAK
jgi:hypothetical protein